MKNLAVFIVSLFALGCVATTTGLDKRVNDVEKRMDRIEMMTAAAEAAADFYPARGIFGGAAGDCDIISDTDDGDICFAILHDDGDLGDAVLIYVLDVDSGCGEDDTSTIPLYFLADDGDPECWELANFFALSNVSPMKAFTDAGGTRTLDEDEVVNTYIYVTVAADFTLPEIGTLAEVQGTVDMVPEGSSFCVQTVGAIEIEIIPHANNSITLDGTENTNQKKITNTSTAGDMICLVACDPNGWCAPSNPDSWTPEA